MPPTYQPLMTTRMSTKGQVVIPRQARELLGMDAGTTIELRIEEDGIKLMPRRKSMMDFLEFAQVMGKKHKMKAMSQKEIDEAIMQSVAELDERTKTKPKKRTPR